MATIQLENYRPTTLADRGVLIKVAKRGITKIKRSKGLVERVALNENLPEKKVSAGIRLFDNAPMIYEWEVAARELIEYWKTWTYRWFDDGTRFAVTEDTQRHQAFLQELRLLRDKCDALRLPIEQNWAMLVDDDIASNNYKLTRDDYPSTLGDRLTIQIASMPVPHEGDFRTEASESERLALRAMLHEAEKAATIDLVKRLLKPLEAMSEKLGKYQPEEGKRSKWSKSLVDQVINQAELIQDLNRQFQNDLDVEKLAQAAKQIVAPLADPQVAKNSPELRQKTAERLDRLQAICGGFGGDE